LYGFGQIKEYYGQGTTTQSLNFMSNVYLLNAKLLKLQLFPASVKRNRYIFRNVLALAKRAGSGDQS
jgi:hypothetical protein